MDNEYIRSFQWYKGALSSLPERTIYLTKRGSRAYHTDTADSDLDLGGIFIAPKEHYLGFIKTKDTIVVKEPVDAHIFEISKLFSLITYHSNPNLLELVYTDPEEWYIPKNGSFSKAYKLWSMIYDNREKFLSKKLKASFLNYSIGQLRKMELHRTYLLKKGKIHKPTREEFGLPAGSLIPKTQLMAAEAQIKKQVEAWNVDLACLLNADRIELQDHIAAFLAEINIYCDDHKWLPAAKKLGFDSNFIEYLKKERAFRSAQNEWGSYQEWIVNRNPKRAKLEEQFGMDLKNVSHVVRLIRMAKEILSEGKVIVKRPDAEELKAIKNDGIWNYDKIMEFAKNSEKEIEELYKTSKLPEDCDKNFLNNLLIKIIEESW